MYEMIYKALKEAGLENKYCPQDYLNFFCLGNREIPNGEETCATNKKEANTPPVCPLNFFLNTPLAYEARFSDIFQLLVLVFWNAGTHSEESAFYDLCPF